MNIKRAGWGIAIGLAWVSAPCFAEGKDELWEISSKMEMAGMPFAMPSQTSKACIPKGQEKDPSHSVPNDKNCKMSDVKVSGNKMSWKMQCEGKEPMSGSGEMTYGVGSYSGKMKMHSKDGDMAMAYDGKRIGSCDAAAEKKRMMDAIEVPLKEAKEKELAECRKLLDEGGDALINGYGRFVAQGAFCSELKKPMCDKVRSQSAEYGFYRRLAAQEKQAGEMKKSMGARALKPLTAECGIDMARLQRNLCQQAGKDKKYGFIAGNCPAEAKALAKQYCDAWGRDYTSDHDNEYAPICDKYAATKSRYQVADEESQDEQSSDSGSDGGLMGKLFGNKPKDGAADKKEEKSDAEGNPAGAVLDGAKKLKGLFGF